MSKKYYVLITILFIGLSLRLYNLTNESIWLDEAYSIYHSQKDVTHILNLADTSPPLYHTILHYWINIFGTSAFATRLLSVLFGTISIYLAYLLGSFVFNKRAGTIFSLLVAISPTHIYFSQEVRTYSLLFMLSLVSMYFYFRLLKRFSRFNILGYILGTSLLIYCHMFALLIVLIQNLYWLTTKKKLLRWVLLQSCVFVVYIPWIAQLPTIIANRYYLWIPKPTLSQFRYLAYHLFSGQVFSIFGYLLTILCVLLLLKHFLTRKTDKIFPIWVLVPILLPFLFSVFFIPVFTPKYVLFVSFPILLLIASSINKKVLVLLIILSVLTLVVQQNILIKNPWNQVSDYIEQKKFDKIVIMNSYLITPFSYYANKDCFDSDLYVCSEAKGIYPLDTLEEMKNISGENILMIVSHKEHNPESQDILEYINDNYVITESKTFQDIKLTHLEKII